jgi:hypothetical protein
LIVLSSGVMTKTGTCARLSGGSTTDAKRQRTANRMESLLEHEPPDGTTYSMLSLAVSDCYCQKLQARPPKNDVADSLRIRQIAKTDAS